jgi:hypothetical protein
LVTCERARTKRQSSSDAVLACIYAMYNHMQVQLHAFSVAAIYTLGLNPMCLPGYSHSVLLE